MSDDEYDDELPPITVNTSLKRDSRELLRMPTAEELASERAREAECERELQALRASDTEVCLHTADSSGSEGEAALAAAVTALQVKAGARAAPASLRELLPPMLSRLPQDYVPSALLEGLNEATPATLATLTEEVCEVAVGGLVQSVEEASCAAVWLCATSVGAESRELRRRSRRALHSLLAHSYFASPDGDASLAIKSAVIGGGFSANLYLELADAVAACTAQTHFHYQLLVAALADQLNCDIPVETGDPCACAWAASSVAAGWGKLSAARAGACVRAAGRLARACPRPHACAAARARLHAALAAPPPAAHTDRLEVSPLHLIYTEAPSGLSRERYISVQRRVRLAPDRSGEPAPRRAPACTPRSPRRRPPRTPTD